MNESLHNLSRPISALHFVVRFQALHSNFKKKNSKNTLFSRVARFSTRKILRKDGSGPKKLNHATRLGSDDFRIFGFWNQLDFIPKRCLPAR